MTADDLDDPCGNSCLLLAKHAWDKLYTTSFTAPYLERFVHWRFTSKCSFSISGRWSKYKGRQDPQNFCRFTSAKSRIAADIAEVGISGLRHAVSLIPWCVQKSVLHTRRHSGLSLLISTHILLLRPAAVSPWVGSTQELKALVLKGSRRSVDLEFKRRSWLWAFGM